jgi:hypothetical protein
MAHNAYMDPSIPKYGKSPLMYKMYEHQIKSKVMKEQLKWG